MIGLYKHIPGHVFRLILARLLLMIVEAGFFLILNIWLSKQGLEDPAIAAYSAYRFLPVFFLALPFGMFIRGRKLKWFFLLGTILMPFSAIFLLQAANSGEFELLRIGYFGMGLGLLLFDVCILPFIMRHSRNPGQTESIALNYSTWSLGQLISGALIASVFFLSNQVGVDWLQGVDEYIMLMVLASLGFAGPILVLSMKEPEGAIHPKVNWGKLTFLKEYDWGIIFQAVFPTALIAIGAGLTIPYINLFFFSVFGLDSDGFSVVGIIVSILIFTGSVTVPSIKRAFGYRIAITASQCLAVAFLIVMAFSELLADYSWAMWLAIIAFLLRTPLMNMAGPMTSELVMKVVGDRNRELTTALISAIWSGAWFISAKIFQFLRGLDIQYYRIFLITAAIYVFGILMYYRLIRAFEKIQKAKKQQ